MARVTVEDCVLRVPNRFELVLVAAQRARDISSGAQITVDRDHDKNPVVALREIADYTVDTDHLQNALVTGLQRQPEIDEPEEDQDREIGLADQTWPQGAGEREIEDELKDDLLFPGDEAADGDDPVAEAEGGVDFAGGFEDEIL